MNRKLLQRRLPSPNYYSYSVKIFYELLQKSMLAGYLICFLNYYIKLVRDKSGVEVVAIVGRSTKKVVIFF
jgi:hypothetical protein